MEKNDFKRGKRIADRTSAAFWDSIYARNTSDLEDLLLWAKEMSNTNCGWQEFALKEVLIKQLPDIIYDRKLITGKNSNP